MGGLAIGVVSIGGFALGILNLGGISIGGLALGGVALGAVAIGGCAIGARARRHCDGWHLGDISRVFARTARSTFPSPWQPQCKPRHGSANGPSCVIPFGGRPVRPIASLNVRYSLDSMAALGCGFNWSAQHMLGLGDATASACQIGTNRK